MYLYVTACVYSDSSKRHTIATNCIICNYISISNCKYICKVSKRILHFCSWWFSVSRALYWSKNAVMRSKYYTWYYVLIGCPFWRYWRQRRERELHKEPSQPNEVKYTRVYSTNLYTACVYPRIWARTIHWNSSTFPWFVGLTSYLEK